jgi:predicted phage terminase large subunit-like protein
MKLRPITHPQFDLSDEYTTALLREDLASFIRQAFCEVNPSTTYKHNWHIDVIADKLIRVYHGGIKRLAISVPPRSLKSLSITIAFSAWLHGHRPACAVMSASYAQDLASKLARDTRKVMESDWYKTIFPATRISPSKSAVYDFETTESGVRYSASVMGGFTGRGADIIIIDDPQRPDDAMSEAMRKTVNDWFDGTVYSRLNDKQEGAIIIVMQRLHTDDLIGHVLEQEDWDVLNLAAIAEDDEHYTYETIFGTQCYHRKLGEALHPARESLHTLQQLRKAIGEYRFLSQYQQQPVPEGGLIIRDNWLPRMPRASFPDKFEMVLQSWDTASKASELSDYSVCTTWGLKDKKLYLLDVLCRRLEFPELKRACIALANQYRPDIILVEDKSSGIQLIQELKAAGIWSVQAFKPQGDKATRLFTCSAMFENGAVILPEDAPWLNSYVRELTSFPSSKHDDQVDSTTQALAFLRNRMQEPGLIAYYRELCEKKMTGCF